MKKYFFLFTLMLRVWWLQDGDLHSGIVVHWATSNPGLSIVRDDENGKLFFKTLGQIGKTEWVEIKP